MAYSASDAAPAQKWTAVTTSDTVYLPGGCRGIYVGGTGDVTIVGQDGVVATFKAVPVGTFMPCAAKRVNATLTTATLLIALY
jgi:hypothetical protein